MQIEQKKIMHNKMKKLERSDFSEEEPVSFSGNYHVSRNHRQDCSCAQKTQALELNFRTIQVLALEYFKSLF